MHTQVLELIAVEHDTEGNEQQTPSADDGGQTHCGLCGLTADDGWDCLSDELGVGVRLRTSADLAPEEQQIVREVGTPCVLARFDDADLHPVVLAERLETFEGDVSRLVREIRLVADQQGWDLPGAHDPHEDDGPEPEEI